MTRKTPTEGGTGPQRTLVRMWAVRRQDPFCMPGGRVEMPPTAAQDLRLCEDPTCGSKERGEYVAGLREVPRRAMPGMGACEGRGETAARGEGWGSPMEGGRWKRAGGRIYNWKVPTARWERRRGRGREQGGASVPRDHQSQPAPRSIAEDAEEVSMPCPPVTIV